MHVSIIAVDACRMEDPTVQRASIFLSPRSLKDGRQALSPLGVIVSWMRLSFFANEPIDDIAIRYQRKRVVS